MGKKERKKERKKVRNGKKVFLSFAKTGSMSSFVQSFLRKKFVLWLRQTDRQTDEFHKVKIKKPMFFTPFQIFSADEGRRNVEE